MGTLAIDIETASPFGEPAWDENDTGDFEWVAVAVGYRSTGASAPETDVLFRRGGWEEAHTADLFDRLIAWCDGRRTDRTLTYNGRRFDLKHVGNWAERLEADGVREGALADLERVLPGHVDLAPAARDRHEDRLLDGQPILPLWKACQLEGVDEERVRYGDYGLDDDYLSGLGVDASHVTGAHVGRVLGERYVEGVVAGLEGTSTHRRLRRLLHDYAVGDVDVLFDLYDALGGEALDDEYRAPSARRER